VSNFGGLILTNKGRALQAKVQAGAALHFNRIGIGDGNLGGSSISDLNALIREKKSLAITKLKTQSGGKAIVGGILSNQDVVVGFYFREIGVFAQDPTDGEILYCYANAGAGAEYIPVGGGPDVVEKSIDIITLIGNASNVTATIASGIYALVEDVGDMSTVPTTAKDAAGAITELHSTIQGIDNHSTNLTYTNGVLTKVEEKDGATVLKTTNLLYTSEVLTSVEEIAGGVTVTTTLTYDGNGTLTGTTKAVV
jgi:hypothetical protein